MVLGKRIKELCEQNNITVKELAIAINMSEANLYKCFKRNSIETRHLEKIAGKLQVDPGLFFLDSNTEVIRTYNKVYTEKEHYSDKAYEKSQQELNGAVKEFIRLNQEKRELEKELKTMKEKYQDCPEGCDQLKKQTKAS